MEIPFTHNARPTLGVEVELHLVDPTTGALAGIAGELLADLGQGHDGEHPKAKHELFRSTVEIITGICDTPADARADLAATLDEVRAAGERPGVAPMEIGRAHV